MVNALRLVNALSGLAAFAAAARLTTRSAVAAVALGVDAEVAALRVTGIGATARATEAGQVALARLATATTVRLITGRIDALPAAANLARRAGIGGWKRLARATHACLATSASVATGTTVSGIRAGLHA